MLQFDSNEFQLKEENDKLKQIVKHSQSTRTIISPIN